MNSTEILAQYGAIGLIAILALAAVRVLFKREVDSHQKDIERADRLEIELRKLNETVQQQYLTVLAQATSAMSEAFAVMKAYEVTKETNGIRRDKKRR